MLSGARNLISASWTQHADARRADGSCVDPWDVDAVSWSLLGALVAGYERLITSDGRDVALETLAGACVLLADVINSESLSEWNDAPGRTQADVLAVIDAASLRPFPSGSPPHRLLN